MSPLPPSILKFSSDDSNSVHSLQSSSLLFSRRLCIFHFPTRKSKSLWDEVGDAVIFNSPFWSKVNFGIGIVSSVVKTGFCASVPVRLAPMAGNLNGDRKSTRLNSSHSSISYAVFCLKKKKKK